MNEHSSSELNKLRAEISSLDSEGISCLRKRLELSRKIGDFKKDNSYPVYDSNREQVVISGAVQGFDDPMKNRAASIMSSVMRVSREVQYDLIIDSDNEWALGKLIDSASDTLPDKPRICCQGTSGSYSHLAAVSGFPGSLCIPAMTFEECLVKLSDGVCDIALLPLENTTAGTVNDVYDLLTEYPFYIARTLTVPIHHKLVVLPGTDIYKLRTVLSHPQALAQCSKYIRNKGLDQIAVDNTAFAVNRLKEINDRTYCAIASGTAGSLNNLEILDDDVCDSVHNQTRFVAVTGKAIITPDANRISISFRLPHQSGSLANVLSMIAERGLSLTKIQSRPVADKPWEYSFWADVAADRSSGDALLMLYQLSKELPFLKFIGWYEEFHSPIDG